VATHVPLYEAKAKLSAMIGRAQDHHEEIVITVHGKPAAVLVSADQFESMQETLDILSDPQTAEELLFGDQDDGEDYVVPAGASPEEILAELRSRHEHNQAPEGVIAVLEALSSAKAAAAEAVRAAESARKSAARASRMKASTLRRWPKVKPGAAKVRARREARKTATDE
jgi:antitoxin YefM